MTRGKRLHKEPERECKRSFAKDRQNLHGQKIVQSSVTLSVLFSLRLLATENKDTSLLTAYVKMSSDSGSDSTLDTIMTQEVTPSQLYDCIQSLQDRLMDLDRRTESAEYQRKASIQYKTSLLDKLKNLRLTKEEKRVKLFKLELAVNTLKGKKKVKLALDFKATRELEMKHGDRVQENERRIKVLAKRQQLRSLMEESKETMAKVEEAATKQAQELSIELNRVSAVKKKELCDARKAIERIPVGERFHEYRDKSQFELRSEISGLMEEVSREKASVLMYDSLIRERSRRGRK